MRGIIQAEKDYLELLGPTYRSWWRYRHYVACALCAPLTLLGMVCLAVIWPVCNIYNLLRKWLENSHMKRF